MSKYESITIKDAMHNIATNKYLLPAIQRKYVWSTYQVERLFDSIMRGYPINSFMLWEISDDRIKQDYKFYSFIKDYCQYFHETNPDASTRLLGNDFFAVIDGQQRLASLYIGLDGTYRYKKPNKWWIDCEENMPTRRLYLDLSEQMTSDTDDGMMYRFSFLSQEDLDRYEENSNANWFRVGKVLDFNDLTDVNSYLNEHGLASNRFSQDTLCKLWDKINRDEIINYLVIPYQDQNKVLDVFVRTNAGGTSLTFSDLLMSISSANWKDHDARKEIEDTMNDVFRYGNPNFLFSQDNILKTILVMESDDIRFSLDNFTRKKVEGFEKSWDRIRKSIVATFNFLDNLGYSNATLPSKNAVIPIIYYVYNKDCDQSIVKPTFSDEDRKNIVKWLNLSLIKGVFGGQSDSVLKKIRDVIKEESTCHFPFDRIVKAFETDPAKNYFLDDAFIDSILLEQYGSPTATLVLQLLYQDKVLRYGKAVAQDHMHPRAVFEDPSRLSALNLSTEQAEFFTNPQNYNSVLNLQLLESSENASKNDVSLADWVQSRGLKNYELLVEPDVSLDIKEFEAFIESRKRVLRDKLKSLFE